MHCYEERAKHLCRAFGYQFITIKIANSKEETIVEYITRNRKKANTRLRQLEVREHIYKSRVPASDKKAIATKLMMQGFPNFYYIPYNDENFYEWCKRLCECLGEKFVSVKYCSSRRLSEVKIEDKVILLVSLLDRLWRKNKNLIKD